MKRADDSLSAFKRTLEAPREGRAPRGPPSTLEQGFGRETIEKLSSNRLIPKVTPKDITGLLSGMDRRRPDASRSSSTLSGSRLTSTSVSGPRSTQSKTLGQGTLSQLDSNGFHSGSLSSRLQNRSDAPEWMSYNPESESKPKQGSGESEPQKYVDDIQAWKARMKEQERREKEKEMSGQNQRDSRHDPKLPSRADSSTSWRSSPAPAAAPSEVTQDTKPQESAPAQPSADAPFGKGMRGTEPIQDIDAFFSSGALDLSKPFEGTSAFDKFLAQHVVAGSSGGDAPLAHNPVRKTDGSRFARFFTEDEPEPLMERGQSNRANADMPGKQLSLDQLFQAHAPAPKSNAAPPPMARMLSEADILETMMGSKTPSATQPAESQNQSEDSFAFSKIMAALAKPPVSMTESTAPNGQAEMQSRPLQHPGDERNQAPTTQGSSAPLQDPSIVSFATKPPSLTEPYKKMPNGTPSPVNTTRAASSSASSETSHSVGSGAPTATTSPSTPTTESAKPATRQIQVAFGGGIPTSVYRQLSGKTDGQKAGSPIIRPLVSANGAGANGGASPSLSSSSVNSPRQLNIQASINQQQQQQQQVPPQSSSKNFGPYNQGPVLHSPVMDPRMGGMYPNNGPSPIVPHGHGMDNEGAFFNNIPMQRPGQGVPPQFAQQLPPFSQQMHVSGPGDFMPPHPGQFVGMPPFGGHPMHPGMFPVEMLMHRGPGGPPPPPRPMPGMGPGPGPNHFVPNNYGHPMNGGMPHHGVPPMNPQFFPPQGSKPMMTREEFERRNRQ
ncbi:hypothetical protein BGW38_000238 [Lunasporangiospora selenospora]|uniref:Uncharacterized protein n=1 Tax=Lunasporangiospora selenospora TaxID=979761 RepID=A0A9P6G1X6_9FUNG|nr:hypothetical protein BGW38_000238 [Lunasporangiospora selenospora]